MTEFIWKNEFGRRACKIFWKTRLIRENLPQPGIKAHYKLIVMQTVELSQGKIDQQKGIVETERHLSI